ncbi:MAG: hypothetical protein UR93_C0008G0011 [Berkelbacteria bacterium GW2011_GWA2_35_9]|uniref:Septum formation initiator n=1 Tax=Berkelbacteria bacterium GW2011_GWA2_35_9 TaxID=1618333 RepID=A0A0G0GAP2_9BACT|nr:MAG: hypothetical protein UR93_C0008G0011 [Berkelbacteria bacterium GW2011_GWA2_35_9]
MEREKPYVVAFKNFAVFFVIVYSAWTVGYSVYKNYQINKEITILKENIEKIKQENKNLENMKLFYQTQTFADIEARRRLNLKRVDEKVFSILPDELKQKSDLIAQTSQTSEKKNDNQNTNQDPNQYKWYQYIFASSLK